MTEFVIQNVSCLIHENLGSPHNRKNPGSIYVEGFCLYHRSNMLNLKNRSIGTPHCEFTFIVGIVTSEPVFLVSGGKGQRT